jgi:hypothetical protein
VAARGLLALLRCKFSCGAFLLVFLTFIYFIEQGGKGGERREKEGKGGERRGKEGKGGERRRKEEKGGERRRKEGKGGESE